VSQSSLHATHHPLHHATFIVLHTIPQLIVAF
jgi:hypothetical protein